MADKSVLKHPKGNNVILPQEILTQIEQLYCQVGLSQRKIAKQLGIDRTTVNKYIRIKELKPKIGSISESYLTTQLERDNISVRFKGMHVGSNNAMYGKRGKESPLFGKKKEYYSEFAKRKENHPRGYKLREDTKNKLSLIHKNHPHKMKYAIEACKSNAGVISSFEKSVEQKLKELNIEYECQFKYDLGIVDFYLPVKNICLFCDGDYWHGNPKYYKFDQKLPNGSTFKQVWNKDLNQSEYLKSKGYNVIRIWESDFKNNPNILESLII